MKPRISPLLLNVNKHTVLTPTFLFNKFACMKYGERLKQARGNMTQAKLAEISGVSQSLISQLENSETATGSEYTPRLSRALGINVDWLADEIGEMMTGLYVTDERMIHLVKICQELPDYDVDRLVQAGDAFKKLAKPGGSGTDG